jgi:hypothetical protein
VGDIDGEAIFSSALVRLGLSFRLSLLRVLSRCA